MHLRWNWILFFQFRKVVTLESDSFNHERSTYIFQAAMLPTMPQDDLAEVHEALMKACNAGESPVLWSKSVALLISIIVLLNIGNVLQSLFF